MVVTNGAKNWVRDKISEGLDTGEYGTDNTSPTVADTDIVAGLPTTNTSLTVTTGNKTVNATVTLLSTVEAGTTIREVVYYMADGTMFVRYVFPDYDHTSSDELQTTAVLRVE